MSDFLPWSSSFWILMGAGEYLQICNSCTHQAGTEHIQQGGKKNIYIFFFPPQVTSWSRVRLKGVSETAKIFAHANITQKSKPYQKYSGAFKKTSPDRLES